MRNILFTLAFGVLVLPVQAFALGLGGIEVNSALNQPLNARVEVLSAVPEDAEVMIVNLASREDFIKAGLDRPHELTALKFRAMVENERVYISVSSPSPIREPSLRFLMEMDWPKGRLLREYTILLEPPVFMGQKK